MKSLHNTPKLAQSFRNALFILSVMAGPSLVHAADSSLAWPQFHGPEGMGVAEDQKPPVELGPDKNVKWKVAVPSGASSPVVMGDKLILTALDDGKLYTIAYSRANGSEVWRAEAPAKQIEPYQKNEGSPAASTSVTDGRRVISYFGSCGLFCYDATGKELWKCELPTVVTAADFGTGVSPILVDGTVILVREDKNDPKIIALDAERGKIKWEKPRQSFSGFGTPTVWRTSEGTQAVVGGYGRMIAYDLQTGDEKWSVTGMPSSCCTTPIVTEEKLYFAGWAPGGSDDTDFKMPSFDEFLKQGDANGDGVITKEESEKTFMKGFFDNNDTNHDGKITRDEWDQMIKYISASKSSAFALKKGGSGDVTKTNILWQKTKGLPYVPSGIVYRGQYVLVKDGGLITAYDAETGKDIYVQQRAGAEGRYYASPVAANGNIYFISLEDGVVTVLKGGAGAPEVVMKNPPLGERVSATPAIANDTLYIRTAGHLYAFGTN